MPTDIAIHAIGNAVQGQLPPAPIVPALGGQQALAENTDSAEFEFTQAVVVAITPSVKVRIDIQRSGVALNPAGSFLVGNADQTGFYALERGKWKIKTLAY